MKTINHKNYEVEAELLILCCLMRKEAVKHEIAKQEAKMSEMLKDKSVDRELCEQQNVLIADLIDIYNSK